MITFSDYKAQVQEGKRAKQFSPMRIGYLWHRNISAVVSYAIVRWAPMLTPNMISSSMILLGLWGCWLVATVPEKTWIGLLCVYASFILDKVDGEVARYTNQQSLRGVYLDEIYHSLIPAGVVGAYFLPRLDHADQLGVVALIVVVFLTIFRRYERKWYIIIATKKGRALGTNTIDVHPAVPWVQRLMNSMLLRLTAVVERFDVLLLAMLIIEVSPTVATAVSHRDFLFGYMLLSVAYSIRFMIRNYYGGLEDHITKLRSNGF